MLSYAPVNVPMPVFREALASNLAQNPVFAKPTNSPNLYQPNSNLQTTNLQAAKTENKEISLQNFRTPTSPPNQNFYESFGKIKLQ